MSIPCRQAFSQEVLAQAKNEKNVVVLGPHTRAAGRLGDFAAELPEQFIEVGIAEQNCVGMAAGLAKCRS
jgi:transketolase